MAAANPDFLERFREGVASARAAQCADGRGNDSHSAVKHWCRFVTLGLKFERVIRPFDPLHTPLDVKLCEVDLVEAYAWWLVTQVGVLTSTAWDYVTVVNAWHRRQCGVGLAGDFPLTRVQKMLDGLQRTMGCPTPRRKRIGVRSTHLRDGMRLAYGDITNARDACFAALMATAFAGVLRAGELASGYPRGAFVAIRHPSRQHLRFTLDASGQPVRCVLQIVNSKARGAEGLRLLNMRVPMTGAHLCPGWLLWRYVKEFDPVPPELEATTPLFRDRSTGKVITVDAVREELRRLMGLLGRDASVYGAHSLRIGAATALAFLGAPEHVIKALGRWRSDAYLLYIRDSRTEAEHYQRNLLGAAVDDFEADELGFEAADLSDGDYA